MNAVRKEPQDGEKLLSKIEMALEDIRKSAAMATIQAAYIEEKAKELSFELECIRQGKRRRG